MRKFMSRYIRFIGRVTSIHAGSPPLHPDPSGLMRDKGSKNKFVPNELISRIPQDSNCLPLTYQLSEKEVIFSYMSIQEVLLSPIPKSGSSSDLWVRDSNGYAVYHHGWQNVDVGATGGSHPLSRIMHWKFVVRVKMAKK